MQQTVRNVKREKPTKNRSSTQTKTIIFFSIVITLLYISFGIDMVRTQLGITKKTTIVKKPIPYTCDIPAWRGSILDRSGNLIFAVSIPEWHIHIDPSLIETNMEETVFNEVNKWHLFDPETVRKAVYTSKDRKYVKIGKTTSKEFADFIVTNSVCKKTVYKKEASKRIYPKNNLLNHVIGIVNSADTPINGIELKLDSVLRGKDGKIKGIADKYGREIRQLRKSLIEPQHGNHVSLTISEPIQDIVERHLDAAMATNHAKKGWIIVQRPYTGEILAMASRPTFTREDYGSEPPEYLRNGAISEVYEPGSIMKALIFSASLNDKIVATNSILDCSNTPISGRLIRDHVQDEETFVSAYAKSSNRASARMGKVIGKQRLEKYLQAYGFGKKTGIDLLGEEKGIVYPWNKWAETMADTITYGQGISVTALQMISMYSTIANNGIRMKPQIIKSITTYEGDPVKEIQPTVIGRVLSEDTAKQMCDVMTYVVNRKFSGTGRRAHIPGYSVAGKTGTADVVVPGKGYSGTEYFASFIGFFPAEAPEVTILVSFDIDHKIHQGGTVAAPVFAAVGWEIARYLNIPTKEELEIAGDDFNDIRTKYIDPNK